MNILVFGDSIASGHWDTGGGWRGMLAEELHQRTIDTNGQEWFEVFNLGFGGETTEELKKRIGMEIEWRNRKHDNLVLIQVGINDSKLEVNSDKNKVGEKNFRKNLREIIDKPKDIPEDLIFVGLTPVDELRTDPTPWDEKWAYRNDEVKRYERIIEEMCSEKNVKFIPLFDRLESSKWKENLWDGVHPLKDGHEQIFRLVKSRMKEENLI
ncbi:MAG: SGNH/GDSL hydrolase family protein [Candidatus Nanohaloarchaea archaeon]